MCRPLTAALPEASQLLAVGVAGIAAGLGLKDSSVSAVSKLANLVEEMSLCDKVMKLELGPGVLDTLSEVEAYLEQEYKQQQADRPDAGDDESEEAVDQQQPVGGSADGRSAQELAGAEKCKELVQELQVCSDDDITRHMYQMEDWGVWPLTLGCTHHSLLPPCQLSCTSCLRCSCHPHIICCTMCSVVFPAV